MEFIVAYYQQQPANEPYFVAARGNLERPGGGLLVLAGCVPWPEPNGRVPKKKVCDAIRIHCSTNQSRTLAAEKGWSVAAEYDDPLGI